jgi:hypothetical protein
MSTRTKNANYLDSVQIWTNCSPQSWKMPIIVQVSMMNLETNLLDSVAIRPMVRFATTEIESIQQFI